MTVPGTAHVKERKSRSLAKAISWRLIAIVILATISYVFTGSWEEMTLITVVYSGLQIFIYFVHERTWDRIVWGKPNALDQLPPASDITSAEADQIITRLKTLGYIESD
jgi:uncharacterized membrane protein